MTQEHTQTLLVTTLSLAVPLWIDRILRERWDWSRITREARLCSDIVASKGDIIQFKGPRKGETAEAFNGLARGLACLAFVPGGVKFLGMHFEVPPAKRPIESEHAVRPDSTPPAVATVVRVKSTLPVP